MKTRTIERLDLLAAETENQLLESIRKHNETLRQIAYQRTVLAEYRERLAETWRHGGVVRAGEVLRASRFADASHAAETAVDALERQANAHLDHAVQNLAQVQERRRGLDEAQRKGEVRAERNAEQRRERLEPWRPLEPNK